MDCRVCKNPLPHEENDCDFKVAPSGTCYHHTRVGKYHAMECHHCYSVHVYCTLCHDMMQLVKRDHKMCDEHTDTIYAWRDVAGAYHCTSFWKEMSIKYNHPITCEPDFRKFILQQGLVNSAEKVWDFLCVAYADFEASIDLCEFNVVDLNLYCLDPNDLRLVHPLEHAFRREAHDAQFERDHQAALRWRNASFSFSKQAGAENKLLKQNNGTSKEDDNKSDDNKSDDNKSDDNESDDNESDSNKSDSNESDDDEDYQGGFKIFERSSATWLCAHQSYTLCGHDD